MCKRGIKKEKRQAQNNMKENTHHSIPESWLIQRSQNINRVNKFVLVYFLWNWQARCLSESTCERWYVSLLYVNNYKPVVNRGKKHKIENSCAPDIKDKLQSSTHLLKKSKNSKVEYLLSAADSSLGPGPTTSDTASCSGSLSCSDLLKNKGPIQSD